MVFFRCAEVGNTMYNGKDRNRTSNLTCTLSGIVRSSNLFTEKGYPYKSNQSGSLSNVVNAATPLRSGFMYFSYVTFNCPFPAALWNLKIISAQSLQ